MSVLSLLYILVQYCHLYVHYVGTSYSQFKVEYYEEDEDDEDTEDETGYKSFVIKRRNCKVTRI